MLGRILEEVWFLVGYYNFKQPMLYSQAIITYQCWYWGYPEGGEGAKVPQNPIRFCHEYCGLCETLYICSAVKD